MLPNGSKTFYDVLGVNKDASQDALRKAWLALARKHHPDKTGGHKGSEEKLKIINEAYDTLKRPEKRRLYDETLAAPLNATRPFSDDATRSASPHNVSDRFEYDVDYSDFFSDLFRTKTETRQHGPRRGRDMEAYVSISLKRAASGTQKSVRLPSMAPCQTCSGSGSAPGTKPVPCPQCKGIGHISNGNGSLFIMSKTCPVCIGRGEIIVNPCPKCAGAGHQTKQRMVSVSIPAGVSTGARLRLAGRGEPGENGGPEGDLFIIVNVEESPLFQRKHDDIFCEAPMTFTQAVLGGMIVVPTLYGNARLKIPPGTQTDTLLRMRGQGFPSLNGEGRGDQLVRVVIEIPDSLTEGQIQAVRDINEVTYVDHYPKHKTFVENCIRWSKN